MTRTQAILDEVRKALGERQAMFDAASNLAEVVLIVKLVPGTTTVRGVVVHDERTFRRV